MVALDEGDVAFTSEAEASYIVLRADGTIDTQPAIAGGGVDFGATNVGAANQSLRIRPTGTGDFQILSADGQILLAIEAASGSISITTKASPAGGDISVEAFGDHQSYFGSGDAGVGPVADDRTILFADKSIGLYCGEGVAPGHSIALRAPNNNAVVETTDTEELGFYNAPPVAQQTGVAVTAAGIHAALVSLGLITA